MNDRQRADEERELAWYRELAAGRDAAQWQQTAEGFRLRNLEIMEVRDQLAAELEKVQWGGDSDGWNCCPSCGAIRDHKGHEPGCTLAAAIARAKKDWV